MGVGVDGATSLTRAEQEFARERGKLRLPPMGWPWDAMAEAVLRWDAARQRHHAAMIAGDVNAREETALEMCLAESDRWAIRQELANQFLAGFRAALDCEPTVLAGLLADLPPNALLTAAIDDLEDRVDAAEDAVVNLETNRVTR